jgi:hypothetical protein
LSSATIPALKRNRCAEEPSVTQKPTLLGFHLPQQLRKTGIDLLDNLADYPRC